MDAGGFMSIDLRAIRQNYRTLKSELGSTPLGGVVKADAYGLGAAGVASVLYDEGCRHTLWVNGTKIRVADIDTPEVSEPKCSRGKALGERAKARLIELVNAGPFEMRAWEGRDEDKYGRKLRVLIRNASQIS